MIVGGEVNAKGMMSKCPHHTGSSHPASHITTNVKRPDRQPCTHQDFLSEGEKKGKTNPHLKTMEESSTQFMIKVQKNLPYDS